MKKLCIIILIFISLQVFGQSIEKPDEVIQQTFYINPAATMTGSSRHVVKFQLPQKTIQWYYTFSAFRNKEDADKAHEKFDLLSELSRFSDPSGTSSFAISMLTKVPGSNYCDVYLLNSFKDELPFKNKDELLRKGAWTSDDSQEGLAKGIIPITNSNHLIGVQYLGIRNPSLEYGINVSIQIVAIVQQEITINGWKKQQKDDLFKLFKTNFNANGANSVMTSQQEDMFIGCNVTVI